MAREVIQFKPKCITRTLAGNLPFGEASMVQNMRARGRALEQRGGQAYLHDTADSTNYPRTLFQFSKGAVAESHFFAQMSDGDVLEKTSAMPTDEGANVFGAEVFSGASGQIPASWAVVDDMMFYSNGVDQCQVFCGDDTPVSSCVVYDSTDTEPPDMPISDTKDYSIEAESTDTAQVVVLDALHAWNAAADGEYGAIYVRTKTPHVSAFNFVVEKANGNAAVMKLYKWNGAWVEVAVTDGTITDTDKTVSQDGAVTFTAPTDVISKYMFGECGFWWRFTFTADLDAEVEVSHISFDSIWGPIQNVWDGVPVDVIEAQFYDESAAVYKTFSADYIKILQATASDRVYFATTDKIEAFYVDVGDTPNETGSTTIDGFGKWTGAAWSEGAPTNDGTNGLANSGWVHVGRQDTAQPLQFQDNKSYLYWWYFTVDKTLSDSTITIAVQYQPYFDIDDFGTASRVCHAWKDRLLLTFDKWPRDVYVAGCRTPMVFNGDDYTILRPGDGRANATTAIASWHNEVIVWQEEKGLAGGCITIFQGYNAPTFGKKILSTELGTAASTTMCVVEGALSSLNGERPVVKLAIFESRKGVFATDGQGFDGLSDDIQNYWDPEEAECVRRGYGNLHFMGHDSSKNVIVMGIVSGASATVPNIFPVLNLASNTWTFDKRAQPLTAFAEAQAGAGNIEIVQAGGMIGYVLQLNIGTNDITTAIDAHSIIELDWFGLRNKLEKLFLRMNVQAAGNCTVTPYENGVAQTALTKDMQAEKTNELVRRHLLNIEHIDEHMSLKFANATASQILSLVDMIIYSSETKDQ